MTTTSRPLGSTRSLASGVGCGAVIVVYTAKNMDIEKGILMRGDIMNGSTLRVSFIYFISHDHDQSVLKTLSRSLVQLSALWPFFLLVLLCICASSYQGHGTRGEPLSLQFGTTIIIMTLLLLPMSIMWILPSTCHYILFRIMVLNSALYR